MDRTRYLQKSGGISCYYKGCLNAFYKKNLNVSFYRFPKDEERCRLWLTLCGRADVLKSNKFNVQCGEYFYKTYRICSEHFDRSMFNNPKEKSRLLPSAAPRPFGSPVCFSKVKPNRAAAVACTSQRVPKKIVTYSRIKTNCHLKDVSSTHNPCELAKTVEHKEIGDIFSGQGVTVETIEIQPTGELLDNPQIPNEVFTDQRKLCEVGETIKIEKIAEPLDCSQIKNGALTEEYKLYQLGKPIKVEAIDETHEYIQELSEDFSDQDKLCKLGETIIKIEVKSEPLEYPQIQCGISSKHVDMCKLSETFKIQVKNELVDYPEVKSEVCELSEDIKNEVEDESSDYPFN